MPPGAAPTSARSPPSPSWPWPRWPSWPSWPDWPCWSGAWCPAAPAAPPAGDGPHRRSRSRRGGAWSRPGTSGAPPSSAPPSSPRCCWWPWSSSPRAGTSWPTSGRRHRPAAAGGCPQPAVRPAGPAPRPAGGWSRHLARCAWSSWPSAPNGSWPATVCCPSARAVRRRPVARTAALPGPLRRHPADHPERPTPSTPRCGASARRSTRPRRGGVRHRRRRRRTSTGTPGGRFPTTGSPWSNRAGHLQPAARRPLLRLGHDRRRRARRVGAPGGLARAARSGRPHRPGRRHAGADRPSPSVATGSGGSCPAPPSSASGWWPQPAPRPLGTGI